MTLCERLKNGLAESRRHQEQLASTLGRQGARAASSALCARMHENPTAFDGDEPLRRFRPQTPLDLLGRICQTAGIARPPRLAVRDGKRSAEASGMEARRGETAPWARCAAREPGPKGTPLSRTLS